MSKLTFVWFLLSLVPTISLAQGGGAGPSLPLSLKRAVETALAPEGNTRLQLAEEAIRQAEARTLESRAALLPALEGQLSIQNQVRNLAALGVRIQLPVPRFTLPDLAGPFNLFDVRGTFSQSIFDFSSIRRLQASRAGVVTAKAESSSARDQVAAQVARLYIGALRGDAALETAKANVALAEALLKLAVNRLDSGKGTDVEKTRASVQLANDQQRLLTAEAERGRSYRQLLKAMDLRLNTRLELTDNLALTPVETLTPEQALAVALESRADLRAQQQREENALLSYSATKLERLPSVLGFADYGAIGTGSILPTRSFGVSLQVPVFDGGKREARRAESRASLRQEGIRKKDLREQIELEIRQALDDLHSAGQQVKVAGEGLTLAENELAQAQRRYQAGVTSSLEVTDAQTRLVRARDNQIAALYSFHQARIDLGEAMGTIRKVIEDQK